MSDLTAPDKMSDAIRNLKDAPDDPEANERYMNLYFEELGKHGMLATTDEEEQEFKRLWNLTAEKFNDAENWE